MYQLTLIKESNIEQFNFYQNQIKLFRNVHSIKSQLSYIFKCKGILKYK